MLVNEQIDRVATGRVFEGDATVPPSAAIETDCAWSLIVAPAQG